MSRLAPSRSRLRNALIYRAAHVSKRWLAAGPAILLMAADPSWKARPASQWTEQDARQLLASSPWAKTATAGIAGRQSEDQLRDAGQMGQPKGVGYEGVDPAGSRPKLPTSPRELLLGEGNQRSLHSTVRATTVLVRWESALPVRLAELKAHEMEPPTLEGDGYRVAVYGVPGGYFKGDPKKLGEPLKKEAVLKRDGKKDVRPSSVEVFQLPDGLAVVYLFPLSAEISKRDKSVELEFHIGRISVAQSFDLSEMEFQGKLEI